MSSKQKTPASNSVRRHSGSRPISSQVKTPETAWTKHADLVKSEPTNRNKNGRSKHETPHRLSERSKISKFFFLSVLFLSSTDWFYLSIFIVKHRTKTPAQDRLGALVANLKSDNKISDSKKSSASGKNEISSDITRKLNKRKGEQSDRSVKECCDDKKSATNQKTSSNRQADSKAAPNIRKESPKRRKAEISPTSSQNKNAKREMPLVKCTEQKPADYNAYNSPVGTTSYKSKTCSTLFGRISAAFALVTGRKSGGSEAINTPIAPKSRRSETFTTVAARQSNEAEVFITPVGQKRQRFDTPTTPVGQNEIPRLFSSKTPAQDRLNFLQSKIENNNSEAATPKPMKPHQHIFEVFRSEFGIKCEDDVEMTASNNADAEDNAMDWEPSDQPVEIPSRSTNFTYIVPDTNVFISSLDMLRRIIDGDMGKSNKLSYAFFSFFMKKLHFSWSLT